MITVELTEYEMQMCEKVGRDRHAAAVAKHRNPGLGPSNAEGHVRGAQCEFACSVGLNLFWRPFFEVITGLKDVGDMVQVRSTVLSHGRLIVKPADKSCDPFVLVRQEGRLHSLVGWLNAGDAKQLVELNSDHGDPAHFVGQHLLLDLAALKRAVHGELALAEAA